MKVSKREMILNTIFIIGCIGILVSAIYMMNVSKSREYKVVLVLKTSETMDFWINLISGAHMGAELYGVDFEIRAVDVETDVEGQIELIKETMVDAPDALLITSSTYSDLTPILEEIIETGVRVVLVDSIIDKDIVDSVVATDNVLAGEKIGRYAASLIEEGDIIGVISHIEDSSTAIERELGLRKGLGVKENCIIDVQFCYSSYERAEELTKEMILQYPNISMVIGLNDNATIGAGRAIKELGMGTQIRMVGIDASMEMIRYIEEGICDGIIVQKAFNMGFLGVEQAVKILMGDEVEAFIDSGCELITRDNLYEIENQKMLFPFQDKNLN